MRVVLASMLIAVALWRASVDWQSTIAQGYAYRLKSLGQVLQDTWPQTYRSFVDGMSAVPLLWDPIGAALFALPLPLILATLAAALWVTRRRARA